MTNLANPASARSLCGVLWTNNKEDGMQARNSVNTNRCSALANHSAMHHYYIIVQQKSRDKSLHDISKEISHQNSMLHIVHIILDD